MAKQQTEQVPEDGCFFCSKDLTEGWCKDIFGYYFCEACYIGEAPEKEEEDG